MKWISISLMILPFVWACSWQNENDEPCRGLDSNTNGIYKNLNTREERNICGLVDNHFNTQPLFSDDLSTAIGHNYMFMNIQLFDHRQLFVILTANNTDYRSSSFNVTFDLTSGVTHNFQLAEYTSGTMKMRFGRNFIGWDYADFTVIKEANSTDIKGRFKGKGLISVQQGANTHVIELDFSFDMKQ
jgi:hypothetical protein